MAQRKKYAADEEVSETKLSSDSDDRVPEIEAPVGDHDAACPYVFTDDEETCSWCLGYRAGQKGVNSVRWNEGWSYGKAV
jgi:hypothetical protein